MYVSDGLHKEVKTCPGVMILRIFKARDQTLVAAGKEVTAS